MTSFTIVARLFPAYTNIAHIPAALVAFIYISYIFSEIIREDIQISIIKLRHDVDEIYCANTKPNVPKKIFSNKMPKSYCKYFIALPFMVVFPPVSFVVVCIISAEIVRVELLKEIYELRADIRRCSEEQE